MVQYQKMCRMMDKLGYAESTPGTQYLRYAAELAATQTRAMMTKDIYPAVAKRYGISPAAAERAMRTATEKATRSPSWEWNWKELGGWNAPTNSEVIMRLARECSDPWLASDLEALPGED